MSGARVSVIVLNYNGCSIIPETLEALNQQTFPDRQIVVVDNGSIDGSSAMIRSRFPGVRVLIISYNIGVAAALNRGIQSVESPYIVLLNNDAVPEKEWLAHMVTSLENHPEAGFAASKMVFYEDPKVIDRAGDGYTRAGVGLLRGRGRLSHLYDHREWVFGACAGGAIYRRSMFMSTGLFDEKLFLLYEDLDLSFRAQLLGYKCLFVPEAQVCHKVSMTIGYDSPTAVYYGHRNLEWVYLQNMPSRLIHRSLGLHTTYVLLSFLYFAAIRQLSPFIRAKRDAARGVMQSIRRRRVIQAKKRVSDDYIWSLMSRERFGDRLRRRYKRQVHTHRIV